MNCRSVLTLFQAPSRNKFDMHSFSFVAGRKGYAVFYVKVAQKTKEKQKEKELPGAALAKARHQTDIRDFNKTLEMSLFEGV